MRQPTAVRVFIEEHAPSHREPLWLISCTNSVVNRRCLRHVRHVKSEYRVVHHSHSLRVRDLVAILNRPFTPIRSNANNFGAIAIVDQRRPDYLFLFSGPLFRCRVPFTIVGPPSSSPSKGLMSISRLDRKSEEHTS